MIGKRFAHYEIVEKLGVGGMGVVYRAHDLQLTRDVAVKFLPGRFAADPERLARFNREARSASALNHPNIVTIHQVGIDDGLPYIVMEFVQGLSLREMVRERPLSPTQVLDLGAQIADGLAKAHAAGIVHRDLKPENVVVTPDGLAKILDFGLAKASAPEPDSGEERHTKSLRFETQDERALLASAATDPGVVLGTAGYMSPEQAAGRSLDFRSDQFSFGSLLYEMACGQRAFDRPTVVQTMASILDDEPPPVGTVNPAVPAPLRWVIGRCLSKDPRQRYDSTQDLARELKTLRDNVATLSGSGALLSPFSESFTALSRRARVVALGLGLVAVASIGAYATRQRWLGFLGLEPLPRERHLVVLPFESDAQDEKGRAFSDGLADTLTSRLGQMASRDGSFWVVPSEEVRRSGVTTAAAARRVFGVTLAVAGQLRHAGERLSLEAQVVDANAERTLRRLTLSTPVAQPADLEEQALSRLASLLDAETSSTLTRPATSPVPPNAYQMYMEGRGYLQRYEDPIKLDSAMSSFQRAVEIDPSYALAYAGMCEVSWRHYELTHDATLVAAAQKACRRALELNDLLAQVHVTLGLLHVGTGRPEDAVADFDRALALDPRNVDAVLLRARPLAQLKRETEAEAEYRRAIALRPRDWAGYNLLARFLLDRGRYGEAEVEFQNALKLTPDNARLYYNLGGLYHKMGRTEDAQRALDTSLRLKPTPGALSNLGALYLATGRYAEGASVFERAVAMTPSDYQLHYNLAWAYYWSPGMRDKARAEYEIALRLGEAQVHVNEHDGRLAAILADCWVSIGEKARARELVEQALKLGKDNAEVHFRVAGTLEQLGDRPGALREVAQALDLRYSWEEVVRDPGLEALRADPGFERLRLKNGEVVQER